MAPRAKKHYVNNKSLYEEIIKYKEKCKIAADNNLPPPRIPRYIGECIMMICKRLSTKPNFMNYSYREDMIADGIENCISTMHNFDPSKSTNPFAYFTQIAWNAFLRRIQSEKKQSYIKHKNYQNSFLMNAYGEDVSMNTSEFSDEVIKSFEDKLKSSKEEKKLKQEQKEKSEQESA